MWSPSSASAFAPCDINGLTLTCDDGIVGAEGAQPEHDFDEEETEEDFEEKPKRSKKRGCRARASRAHKKASASSGGGKKRRRYTADKTSMYVNKAWQTLAPETRQW